MPALIVQWLIV